MTNEPLLLALDQGTSSSRAALFTPSGALVASANAPLSVDYPQDGWVEQNPIEIFESQLLAMKTLEQKLTEEQRKSVVSCGITNQRETTILWRRSTGDPCGPALVWQDGRTSLICSNWKNDGLEKEWKKRTGLLLDPYFSASKINWLINNETTAIKANSDDDLCFGTVESWLLWKLTSGRYHFSDMSNASRTLLMDLENRTWINPFLDVVGITKNALPQLVPCQGEFGAIERGLPFSGTPIQALLGDQQAATFGQLCLNFGDTKCTYGTGAFLVVNTGKKIHRSQSGLLSTIGWTDEEGSPTYCLEGSLFNAGTVIQWLRDGLGIISKAEEINQLADSVENSAGVMIVPAFTGLGTPYWDPKARGIIIGITRDTNQGHIAKAALEGIAFSVGELIELAEKSLGRKIHELAVDGGAAQSKPLLQSQANIAGVNIRRPKNLESTAKGVALLAGLQVGVIKSLEELIQNKTKDSIYFSPNLDEKERYLVRKKWDNAARRSLNWYDQ